MPDDSPGWHRNRSLQHEEQQPRALCCLHAWFHTGSPKELGCYRKRGGTAVRCW